MKLTEMQIDDIEFALDDNNMLNSWYWDRDRGETLFLSDMLGLGFEESGFEGDPDENPKRYLPIDGIESNKSFRVMESFTENLPEGQCRRSLTGTLNSRKPFANFNNTLQDFPEQREAWFAHQNQWLTQQAHAFIKLNELGEV